MSYTNDLDNPELYFQTKLYTGNGGTQSITLDGSEDMQPDWVWIKNRSGTDIHALYDSVRGVNKNLRSDANSAEGSQSTGLTSFDSDGFGVGDTGSVNTNSNNFVSWNWKMGTSFSNDASATSVGTIDSTGSINTAAGQSIISYSGTGSAGTVAHGLGAVPKMIIVKSRSHTKDWTVYHSYLGNTKWIELNATTAEQSSSNRWNNTSPTSSVFTVATDSSVNASGYTYIAYCFSEIKGYSKFGVYTGNANASGGFAYLGFRPAFVIVRDPGNAENWLMYDNKRPGYNLNNNHQFANTNDAETASTANTMDLLSNGFKVRSTNNGLNRVSSNFFYMAFAESPFVNSNGVPNNAR